MNKLHSTIKTTRKELYEWVWNEPMMKLAKKLGLSDVGLKKTCKRHNIPTPGLGYWRQKECGTAVPKPKLPKPNDNPEITFTGPNARIGKLEPGLIDDVTRLVEHEADPKNKITVPTNAKKLHPLAERTKKALLDSNTDYKGMHYCKEFPETLVSRKAIPRAVRIIDSLMKAMERRGFLRGEQIVIFGSLVGFELMEIQESRLNEYGRKRIKSGEAIPKYDSFYYDRVPSGRLHLSINGFAFWAGDGLQNNWKDGKKQRIEDCLNSIIIGLIRKAALKRERRLERLKEEKERRRVEHRREAVARRVARKEARIRKLGKDLNNWQQASELRAYLAQVRHAAEQKDGTIDPDTRFGKWMAWAEAYVDRIDPLQNGEALRVAY